MILQVRPFYTRLARLRTGRITNPSVPISHRYPSFSVRFQNTSSNGNHPSTLTSPSAQTRSRLQALVQKYPKLAPLLNAPISHITSFLILHELTAVIPLAGIFWILHSLDINLDIQPSNNDNIIRAKWNSWVNGGVEKFTKYATKKRWIKEGSEGMGGEKMVGTGRVILEVATSYAVVKALLPVRIGVSLWATPWFARVVVGRVFRVGKKTAQSG